MVLGRLKIRTRIYAGFGSLIALSLLVAASGSWGIDSLGTQTTRMTGLVGNVRYVATALQGQEAIARILLRASVEPDDALNANFQQAQASVREALTQARANTISAERKKIYESVLSKLDVQVFFGHQTFDLGRKMLNGRATLFTGGDALSAETTRLVEAAGKTDLPDIITAAAATERAVLLVRVANWRFLATKDAAGPDTFKTNVQRADASLDSLEKLDNLGLSAQIKIVRKALTAYRDAFAATAPSLLGMVHLYDTVEKPLIVGMQDELSKADLSLAADAAAASSLSASVQGSTNLVQRLVAGLALLGGLAAAFFIGRGIARPIAGMTSAMAALAAGNHHATIPGEDSRDEIGDMARAVNVFRTSMIEAERLRISQEAARAARSRRQDAMDQSTQAFGSSVTGVMTALGNAAGNMRSAADVMAESAAAVRHQAAETAGDAGQSSADLTAVAAAVEEFTASVGEISRQVAVASEVAAQAVQRAEASQATIRGLADSTARIGDVVRLIDSIAGQTNLLALNATIEAARAGDAGKGFAVVAGEVKALAAQTAKATAEIGAQIETVRGATEDTVASMNDIGAIIGRMGEISTAISAAVEEQSVTTREIATSIQGVAGSTARAAGAMENVVQVADRAGDASRDIQSEAAEIGTEAEKLRREVEQFLSSVLKDSSERRRFERISGSGATATLRLAGAADVKAPIQDLSRNGVALRHAGAVSIGTDVQIELPDAGGSVSGKVMRAADGVIGIAFSTDATMLARIERSLACLSGTSKAA